ncbi:hypothetical protein INT44_006095 [Umbelopsis vinacea]|uniref:Uncharacterized protein n=1 Tax=Umbelopsis vinacea TaxID=44442 RepID=A0A8H7ULD8_9FUNG|nr:hypothetical protein INT44_006095 [Umbelopsis vinacea]
MMKLTATSILSRSILNLTPRVTARSYSMIPSTPFQPNESESLSDHGKENDAAFLKSLYERNDSHSASEHHHQQTMDTHGSTYGHNQHGHAEGSSSHESLAPRVNTVFED